MKRFKRNLERGFTLIEVSVSLSILAIGLLSLAAIIPLAKSDVTRSDQRTRSVFLAQESVEWLHGLAYADPLLSAGTHTDANFNEPGYTRGWSVVADSPITDVKRVTVTITRTGATGQSSTIVFLHSQAGH